MFTVDGDLAVPPFPRVLDYLWRAYIRLRRRAAAGFGGPQPIAWQDIDAFIRRAGLKLAPWEIEMIEALDDIYLQPPPPRQAAGATASADDAAGVRAILSSVAARRKGGKNG